MFIFPMLPACPTPFVNLARTLRRSAVALAVSIGTAAVAEPAAQLSVDLGQLAATPEWLPLPDDSKQAHLIQRTSDGRLFLTPNESFFPKLGLTADGEGKGVAPDVIDLNGGKSFATITDWSEGDAAEWGIWLEKAGELELHVWMTSSESGEYSLAIDGVEQKKFSSKTSRAASATPELAESVSVAIGTPGRHIVGITCTRQGSTDTRLHWIEVSGPAASDAGVLRKRWRPAAAHTKFTSSRNPDAVRLWVMEMDAVPGDLDFYAPLTSPFGYYGPTWNADGTVNSSFNFSLWSFGRGEPEPPVDQLSHLIAIGNREATFGHFDHEGTGVKIRDWEPLLGRQGQSQALALRIEPGESHDTYFSYFYASDERRWRLFGIGKKNHKGRSVESLWVGSFVEVPGPPPRQRTGPYERRMLYRGWIMDERGKWYPLDQMSYGDIDKDTGLTYTDRGVTDNGWFYLQTGGWTFRKAEAGAVDLGNGGSRPEYLNDQDLKDLASVPCSIEVTNFERSGSRAQVSFDIVNLGKDTEVIAYWGDCEGLTMVDRWKETTPMEHPAEGSNRLLLEGVPESGPLMVRLFLRNDEGQFWSMDTSHLP